MNLRLSINVLLVLLLFQTSVFCQNLLAQLTEIGQYQLYEHELVSSKSYSNPYTDVSLTAQFQGPNGEQVEIEGFWYGSDVWKIRMMPTAIGRWSYTTSSNESSLDGLSGEFLCGQSSHPGIVEINPDNPYTFKLSTGEPFFLMGETAWYLMSNAVPFFDGTFQQYIQKRKEQKFNFVQFVLGTGGLPYGTKNPENEGGKLWVSQNQQKINPEFFKWVDKRISFMDSTQMGIGFFITWAQHFSTFSRDEFERFTRYLIARYAAYPLLFWIVVGEFDEVGSLTDYDYFGNLIKTIDPYGHIVSIHPDGADPQNVGSNRIFADEDWLDYIMHQYPSFNSGEHSVYELNQYTLADRVYNIPVVNAEFKYENEDYLGEIFTSDDVRKYAWTIVVSGAFPCYGHADIIRTLNLDAMESDGANYMTRLYNFWEQILWWNMNPNNSRVENGFCIGETNSDYVIYLPEGGSVNVNFDDLNGTFRAQWYDPKNGEYSDFSIFYGGAILSLTPPFPDDVVLHIQSFSAPCIAVQPDSLYFACIENSENPLPQFVTVTNLGSGDLFWTASENIDQPWLTLENTTGSHGDFFTVAVNSNGLAAGSYAGTILIQDISASNNPVLVPVKFAVLPNQAELLVVPTTVDFDTSTTIGFFEIKNSGEGTLFWHIKRDSLQDWIVSVNPDSGYLTGNQSDSVFVQIDRSGKSAGNYEQQLTILSNIGSEQVLLTMQVVLSPILSVIPAILDFQSTDTSLTFEIANIGEGVLNWNVSSDSSQLWIETINPQEGILASEENQTVAVEINRNGLLEGSYLGTINIKSNGGNSEMLLYMTVVIPPELSVSPSFSRAFKILSSFSYVIPISSSSVCPSHRPAVGARSMIYAGTPICSASFRSSVL